MNIKSKIDMNKQIIKSFVELLKQYSFSSITIDDISNACLIHRNTFYNHFENKYELLDKIIRIYFPYNNLKRHINLFKQKPFKFFYDYLPIDLKLIFRKQKNDKNFINTVVKTIFNIIEDISDKNLTVIFEQISGILLWYRFNDKLIWYNDDYKILDKIYQSKNLSI